MISLVTFTGLDSRSNFSAVRAFSEEFPFAEFGILLSLTPDDKDERYMTIEQIYNMILWLKDDVRLALHICGSAVNHFVRGTDSNVLDLARHVGRVQLNFNAAKADFTIEELNASMASIPGKVITQHFPSNAELVDKVTAANHQVLFDASGGRGLETTNWLMPFERKTTGYAGGLGPEGIDASIDAIQAASGNTPVWIDMESRVRTDGWLDIKKCHLVANAVEYRVGHLGNTSIDPKAILA